MLNPDRQISVLGDTMSQIPVEAVTNKCEIISPKTEICLSGFNIGTLLFFLYLLEIYILKRNMPKCSLFKRSQQSSDVGENVALCIVFS